MRLDAAEQPDIKRMLLLFESVYYEADTTSLEQGKDIAKSFLYECQTASRETIKDKEESVKEVYRALKYMQRFGYLSKDNSTIIALEALMDGFEWR